MMDGWDGAGMTGWVLMGVFWVVLVAAILWALGTMFPARATGDAGGGERRPEEILDRRLAQGEIDPATYDELRARLRGTPAGRT